ncbi:MAG: hypothetical protein AAGE52_05480 [Myxococcota bacterium]
MPVLLVGCFENSSPDPTYSRNDARRLGGVSPDGDDLCELNDWYGDGICDSFCPMPDSDCVTCPDPLDDRVFYVSTDPAECAVIDFACPEGTTGFSDVPASCGCGCIGTPAACAPAIPTDIEVPGCDPTDVFVWNGTACVETVACDCTGVDAECFTFPNQARCEEFYADCGGGGGVCDAMDAFSDGLCDLAFGVKWNGESCEFVSGCECDGEDCDNLYESVESCEIDRAVCTMACGAMDAAGEGPCEAEIGVLWNGSECVTISGCSCVGEDCGALYETELACQMDRRSCVTCDPAPGDPGVEYIGNSPAECATILFGCPDDQRSFENACGCGCEPLPSACEAQDARAVGGCEPAPFYVWDGESCRPEVGCSCEGADCDSVYADEASCLAANDGCLSCDPAPGDPGVSYVGESPMECALIDFDCSFPAEYFANDCGCGCQVDCGPMDVREVGTCEPFRGYAWDGESCNIVSGCACEGSDCDSLFPTQEECEVTFTTCRP